jgi:hypothetical protein
MAFPIALLILGAGAGAYFLMQPSKPKAGAATTPANPVVVPPTSLPTPPGGVPAEQMPGGPPTVVITPPATTASTPAASTPAASTPAATAQTPQQILTQALPQLLQNVPQLLPQQAQPATPATPEPTAIKTVPAPGATSTPAPTATPAAATTPAVTPQQILTGLPQAAQQILNQAVPSLITATPIQAAETHPDLDPKGTIALAKLLIDREASAGWKSANQSDVLAWQKRVGLTADGKFGEKGELRMAQEVGILPLIRYWPASTLQGTEVPKYQAALRAYAATVQASNPAHAIALNNSAAFEVGQSYAANPAAIPVSLRQGQADLLSQVLKS